MENDQTDIPDSSLLNEAIIVPGSTNCLGGTHPVAIKNVSSRSINVTYEIKHSAPGTTFPPSYENQVLNNLAPGMVVDIGCSGCGTFSGIQRCTEYRIVAIF